MNIQWHHPEGCGEYSTKFLNTAEFLAVEIWLVNMWDTFMLTILICSGG